MRNVDLILALLLAGCATTKAPVLTPEEQAAREAEAEAAHRTAWLQANEEALRDLSARAGGLAATGGELEHATRSHRGGVAGLEAAGERCDAVRAELETYAEALSGRLDEYGDPSLPGLPDGWASMAGVGEQRRAVGEACDRVPELISTAEKELAAAEDARGEQERLAQGRRTKKAVDAVAKADEVLRGVVGDSLFVRYLDALDAWQVAATMALREERKPEPDAEALKTKRRASVMAEEHVAAINGSISLTISGRSNEVSDAIAAAGKALKPLSEEDRTAVLGAFPPEVTPASSVLHQLIEDRIRAVYR